MTKAPPAREHKLELAEVLDALGADGVLNPAQVKDITVRQGMKGADGRHPLVIVAGYELPNQKTPGKKLTLDALVQWLAARSGLAYHRIDPLSIDVTKVTGVIPYAYAARAKILPIKVSTSEITVATAEPWLREWERDLALMVKQKITRVVASPLDIERYVVEFYALSRSVKAHEKENQGRSSGVQNLEQLIELGARGKMDANDSHIVAIVDWLLQYAFEQRASDIHLEPRREHANMRFRIDGVLHDVYQIPATVIAAVTSRIKVLSRMDLSEKRRPQDGRIKTRSPSGKEIELRVSALPTAFGEKLVMRIFDPEVLVRDFRQLGLNAADEASWRRMIEQPHGIILVTGPTGSGKTTTLYSTLKLLATSEVNVCTIEDPIELVEPSFNQMQVNAGIELNFADGIRALLRQDPDIIMVGEIRDLETAEIAVQAALTGHLVLSTLHTNDSVGAITRMGELGVPAYLIRAVLLGVVAQRLVRTLCPHCKRPAPVTQAQWDEWTNRPGSKPPAQAYEPVGCLECRETGYLGRAGVYEILPLSDTLLSLIKDDTDAMVLRAAAFKQGLLPLRLAGMMKVAAGETSAAEVLANTPPA